MLNSTTNTYTLKRKILSFSNKISRHLSKPERKFTADITYGMLASGSCLLTDVVDQLHESSKKINIDDSDVVKPDGYKFEALGIVRDGSESTSTKNVYKKGYHVTEACVLTSSNHPVSIFSRIHSSSERDYKSANAITFQAMEQGAALFKKATFAMNRGYDDNKMFLKMDELGQDYVIRVARTYFSRWKIEEYFRCKKQMFQFENFRVRKLVSINALNFYITLCMAFLAMISMESETNARKVSIIKSADPIKEKVFLLLPASKRYLWYTVVYKRRRQAPVPKGLIKVPLLQSLSL
ncbi:MAG: hypothetical protein ACERKN_15620 [Velocimicrobium sp.]